MSLALCRRKLTRTRLGINRRLRVYPGWIEKPFDELVLSEAQGLGAFAHGRQDGCDRKRKLGHPFLLILELEAGTETDNSNSPVTILIYCLFSFRN